MASSGSQSATVLYPQPPTVTLEAPDQLKVGDWGHVVLHVEQFDQFIDQGSPITVTDGAGNVLAHDLLVGVGHRRHLRAARHRA